MRTKKVTRYYCDFCSKGYFRIDAIKHHEERCTANPYRKCGMCSVKRDYLKYVKQMEEYVDHDKISILSWLDSNVRCPACILTVLRLSKRASEFSDLFKFSEAMEKYNEERANEDPRFV